MIFRETGLSGAYVMEPERRTDERGFFARTLCQDELAKKGLVGSFVQANVSFNTRKGTLRGMHFQVAPREEVKVVRCTMGAIFDVIVDLRSNSKTFKRWFGLELTAENRLALYVPAGFAHGFQTLEDSSEVLYEMGEFYSPEHARGVRHDDRAFAIRWPLPVSCISERDARYPDFEP